MHYSTMQPTIKEIFLSTIIAILGKLFDLKILFSYNFFSDLMYNKDVKGWKFVCVGVEFLAYSVLFHTRSEQKVIVN